MTQRRDLIGKPLKFERRIRRGGLERRGVVWFEELTGFREESPGQVRANLTLDGNALKSKVNGRVVHCGRLETPSLAELRVRVDSAGRKPGRIAAREVFADVKELHRDGANAGVLFQVASQFNLLEMVSPDVTPERGVGVYEGDPTQGPACAVACGAGTIYRNYFAPVNGRVGQTADNQIDCLADLGGALGNSDGRLWTMRNGYALPTREGLAEVARALSSEGEVELDRLRGLLRVRVEWDTEVTLKGAGHRVSQVYCSALPVAYSGVGPKGLWEGFARLVLEAAYEATFCVAALNAERSGNKTVFLTLLGGGAFGNDTEWIVGSVRRALDLYRGGDLDVAIVSYGSSRPYVKELIR